MTFWSFLSIILLNSFANELQALEVSQNVIKIEKFDDLNKNPDIKIMVIANSGIQSFMKKIIHCSKSRLVAISHDEKFSLKTIVKIVDSNHVLIEYHQNVRLMIKHYNQFNLIQSIEDNGISFYGFPFRKSLSSKLKQNFYCLYVFEMNYQDYQLIIDLV